MKTEILPLGVTQSLQDVKELYAELFLMLMQSVIEDPLDPATHALDAHVEDLMHSIESHMRKFRDDLAWARGQNALEPGFDAEVDLFQSQLREGLQAMSLRVATRSRELSQQRDEFKTRLRAVQQKQRGAKGYRRKASGGALLQSEI